MLFFFAPPQDVLVWIKAVTKGHHSTFSLRHFHPMELIGCSELEGKWQWDVGSQHGPSSVLHDRLTTLGAAEACRGSFLYDHVILKVHVFPITGEGTSLSDFPEHNCTFDLHWSFFFFVPPPWPEDDGWLDCGFKTCSFLFTQQAACVWSVLTGNKVGWTWTRGRWVLPYFKFLFSLFPRRGLFAVLFLDLRWLQRRILFWNNWQSVLLHAVFGRYRGTFSV